MKRRRRVPTAESLHTNRLYIHIHYLYTYLYKLRFRRAYQGEWGPSRRWVGSQVRDRSKHILPDLYVVTIQNECLAFH